MNKPVYSHSVRPSVDLGINPDTKTPYRVFFVDDSLATRTFLRRIFTRHGFHICGEAEHGQMAIDAISKMNEPPDIFCIDQDMPIMDGVTFIKNIRPKLPNVKIIMITGISNKTFIQEILHLKINAYVKKPIVPQNLTEKLAGILGRKELLESGTAFKTTSIDLNSLAIPSMPEVVLKVAQFDVDDLDRGIRELEEIILPDSGIVSQILKISNSSYYGFSKKVTTIKDAITLLGIKMVKNIVIMNYKQSLNKTLKHPIFITHLRKLPVLSSLIAFDMVKPLNVAHLQKNIFILSLLRQFGMNILAANFSEQYQKILKLYGFNLKSIYDLEKEEFNLTSIEIAEKIFKLWNMPETYIQTISRQNFSANEIEQVEDSDRITRLADILAKLMLEIQIPEPEKELISLIYDYYNAGAEIREIFNTSYFENISDHPFISMMT